MDPNYTFHLRGHFKIRIIGFQPVVHYRLSGFLGRLSNISTTAARALTGLGMPEITKGEFPISEMIVLASYAFFITTKAARPIPFSSS